MKILILINIVEGIVIIKLIELSNCNKEKDYRKELRKEKNIKEALFQLNHEIKNPLAVVNGYLELYSNTNSRKKKDEYLKIIRQEVSRTLTIINDFSALGKIKKVEKEVMDLGLLFEEIIDLLQPIYKENNSMIVYKNKQEIMINACFERLKQVFINILKNALESKDKEFLIVEIKVKRLLKEIKISIIDNGRGMSQDELTKINNAFYSTKKTGTGIGLIYARQIIELHGGKLEFKSKEKKGTEVTITLPININD